MRKKNRGTEVERGNIKKKSLLDKVKGLLYCIPWLYFTVTADALELFPGHLGGPEFHFRCH